MRSLQKTEIGEFPENWNINRIDDHFDIQQGKQVSKKNRIGDNQRPFLRTANVFWGYLDLTVLDQMHFTADQEEKFALLKDDLLVCEGGAVGRTAIWNEQVDRCYYQNHLHRLRAKNGTIDPLFTMYWLQYGFEQHVYFGRANETTLSNLSKSRLAELLLPIPVLNEQRTIAHILSTVQKAIEKQDQLIRTTTELKKALMQKLFTEGLRGEKQKETEFGLVPGDWEVQPFENTGEVIYGIQAAVANNIKPIGHKILTNKNITLDGKIDLEKLNYFELSTKRHFNTILKKGDLLFNWRSGSKEHVGKTALFDLEEDEYTHSSFILRIRVNKYHNNVFLYYYLNYLREVGYYQKVQTYSVNAKFNKSAINAMPIALPEKDEQDEIADMLSTIDKKLDYLIAKKNAQQDLFKTLLHELMTGKIDVSQWEQEEEQLPMAAEPETEFKPKRHANEYFRRTVLAAYIVDHSLDDPLFNKTKFQKLLYLAQFAGELDIISNYHRDAAGPYDNQMMRSVYSQLSKLKWFGCRKVGKEYKYFPLEKSSAYKRHFQNHWGEHQQTIDRLLELFRPFDYERCEIVATLFECWIDMIRERQLVNEATLVSAYNDFHPQKKKQPENRIVKAFNWMKEENIVPLKATVA